jgi:FK506-binding protein 1
MPPPAKPAPPADTVSITLQRAGDVNSYPQPTQSVAIHYDAYLPNGKLWDSSRKRKRPLRFRLGTGQVIAGLDEGVAQLSVGSRAYLKIPASLAYGERGFPGLVPPNTAIEFDIEVLDVM